MPLLIESPSFEDTGVVAPKYSCFGDNVQPGFKFRDPPEGTKSYAIIFHDIDVALDCSTEDGLHWIAWNIPAAPSEIAEGSLPEGAVTGRNVEDKNAYLGPGAPAGARYHHYVFEFYALDALLDLPDTASRAELLGAMQGRVLGKAAYVGRFRRAR